MKPRTNRFTIGRHTILQNGPTLIDLTTHREFSWVTEFKVWNCARQIGAGHVEDAEISWNAGERIADDVKAQVEQMLRDELPEFERAEEQAERAEDSDFYTPRYGVHGDARVGVAVEI